MGSSLIEPLKLIINVTSSKGKKVKRKRERIFYNYECTLTGQSFSMTEKAPNPAELVSVEGYYQLHPDKNDRPAAIKKQLAHDAEAQQALDDLKKENPQ
jgi:hypothetical protein